MPHYVGLDVSQKTTTICVVDEQASDCGEACVPLTQQQSLLAC